MDRICKHCGAYVKEDVCEYCGIPLYDNYIKQNIQQVQPATQKNKSNIKIIGAVTTLVVAFVGVIAISRIALTKDTMGHLSAETEGESISVDFLANAREKGTFPSGTYKIGDEIPASEYLIKTDGSTPSNSAICVIYADKECEEEVSGDWHWFDYSRILDLQEYEGCYIEIVHGSAYDTSKNTNISNSPFEHCGMFKAGTDFKAGTYRLLQDDSGCTAQYTIYSSIDGIAPDVKESGFAEEDTSITLSDGEYLELKFCTLAE